GADAEGRVRAPHEYPACVPAAVERSNGGPATFATGIFFGAGYGFFNLLCGIDILKIFVGGGFDAVREFTSEPKTGQVMIVSNGGTVLFYVIGHDAAVARRLVEFLQRTDFAGVIFTREGMEGTFTLEKARVDNEHAPDVEMDV